MTRVWLLLGLLGSAALAVAGLVVVRRRRRRAGALTAHFAVSEFDCHDGTPYPAGWVESRLRPLAEQLEILRAELGGHPMIIVSGYRTESYNAEVGGAARSQHLEGRAADVQVVGVDARTVHETALRLAQAGRLRIGGLGHYDTFTHLDIRTGDHLARWDHTSAGADA